MKENDFMKKLKIINWYIIALLLAAISAVSLRTYALLTSFNPLTMYFENSTAIKIANWIVVAGVLLFMTYVIFGEKKCDLIAKTDNAATYIPSGIVCVALIFMGIERLQNIPAATPENQIFRALSIITPIFALISVVSLFVSIFFERKHSLYKAAFSLSMMSL